MDLTSHLHASVRYILLVLEANFVSFYREAEELAEVEAKLVGLVFTFMALYVCFIRFSTPHFFSSSLCYQDADWKTNTSSAKGQGKVIRVNNLAWIFSLLVYYLIFFSASINLEIVICFFFVLKLTFFILCLSFYVVPSLAVPQLRAVVMNLFHMNNFSSLLNHA